MVWKQSRESISQLCKRLRRKCISSKPETTEGIVKVSTIRSEDKNSNDRQKDE